MAKSETERWTNEEYEALGAAADTNVARLEITIQGRTSASICSKQTRLDRLIEKSQLKTKGYAIRTCLPCGRKFGSDHIGNRICSECKPSQMFRTAA